MPGLQSFEASREAELFDENLALNRQIGALEERTEEQRRVIADLTRQLRVAREKLGEEE